MIFSQQDAAVAQMVNGGPLSLAIQSFNSLNRMPEKEWLYLKKFIKDCYSRGKLKVDEVVLAR